MKRQHNRKGAPSVSDPANTSLYEGVWILHEYPKDLMKIKLSISEQPDHCTCGPAGIFNGFLLGGMISSITFWSKIFRTHKKDGTSGETLQKALNRNLFGLDVSYVEKRARESTASFLKRMGTEIAETGAFILLCIRGGEHWITGGLWKDERLWTIDSFGNGINLKFSKYSPDEFDGLDWEDCVQLVRPGRWKAQFMNWLPARESLLTRASVMCSVKGLFGSLNDAMVMLQDENYTYDALNLRLTKGTALRLEYNKNAAYRFKRYGHRSTESFFTINDLLGDKPGEIIDVPQIAIQEKHFSGFDLE